MSPDAEKIMAAGVKRQKRLKSWMENYDRTNPGKRLEKVKGRLALMDAPAGDIPVPENVDHEFA